MLKGKIKVHHSIGWRSLGETSCEAVDQGRVVVVGPHQFPPDFSIDFQRRFPTKDVCHSTSSPELVIAWNPMVTTSLDVPGDQVLWSSLPICKKCVPDGVADEEIHFWCCLICQTHLFCVISMKIQRSMRFENTISCCQRLPWTKLPRMLLPFRLGGKNKVWGKFRKNLTYSKKWSFNGQDDLP